MAETATVGELLVRIRADLTDLERGLSKATAETTKFSTRAAPGMRTITNSMRALAFQAAGIPGPIGRITGALLMMSAGGTVTIGVVAGIGIIALAWRKLTSEAREAAKAQAEALKLGIETPLAKARENLRLVEKELSEAEAKRRQFGPLAAFTPFGGKQVIEATQRINDARKAVEFWTNEVERLDEAWQDILDRIEEIDLPKRLRVPGLNEPSPFTPGVIGPGTISGVVGTKRGFPQIDAAAFIAADRWVQKFGDDIRKKYEITRAIGESIGYALADGINAVLSGGNFLKSLGRSLLGIAINVASSLAGRAIGNALFPGGGEALGLLSGGGGGSILGKVAAPASPVDFSSFPAASNPLASARDSEWLRFLGASNLQLRQYGFR